MSIKQNGGVFGRNPTFNNVTAKSVTADTVDINGGTIDGTVIGGTTPAAVSGTTGTFSSTLSAANSLIITGGITAHGASRATFSQEGAGGAFIQSYGANTSTKGAFVFRQASSDFSVTATPLAITSIGEINLTRSGDTVLYLNRLSSDGAITDFRKDGSTVGTISITSSATAYNTSSDYRLKEDDAPMTGATERVKALRPINFAWKVDGSRVDGFFAHEAQDVVPECVTGTKDAMKNEEYEVTPAVYEDVTTPAVEAVLDKDGVVITAAVEEVTEFFLISEAVTDTRLVPDYQGIDQSKLVPLLTAALQEAITKIEALTTRIETLEGQ